jgi:CheY-like chemotaxis protein
MTDNTQRSILVIDDSEAIHQDFLRILCPKQRADSEELDLMADSLFGESSSSSGSSEVEFEVDSAFQGREGLARVKEAQAAGRPYAMAFLDHRMPPGWNGVETLRHLRAVAPSLPVVLCSAYSDYSWEDIVREFGRSELLLELRKPFNSQQVRQLVLRLTGTCLVR